MNVWILFKQLSFIFVDKKFCGKISPENITFPRSDFVTWKFITDSSVTKKGGSFKISTGRYKLSTFYHFLPNFCFNQNNSNIEIVFADFPLLSHQIQKGYRLGTFMPTRYLSAEIRFDRTEQEVLLPSREADSGQKEMNCVECIDYIDSKVPLPENKSCLAIVNVTEIHTT